MMSVAKPQNISGRGHPSGRHVTGYAPVAAAGADRRAGSVADPGVGDSGGDRAGAPAGHDQAVGCRDRAGQDPIPLSLI